MAGERGQKKVKDKWREKNWYTIVSPAYMGGKEIAMSPGNSPEGMIGRKIETPVSDLTGNFKKAGVKAVFRITGCQGTRCETEFVGHFVGDDYVRRMVRRRKERMDVVTRARTNDGYTVSVKAVIVTDNKLTNSRKATIRKNSREALDSKAASMSLGEFAAYMIGDEAQAMISSVNKDIYPLKKIEVRKSEVMGRSEMGSNVAPEPIQEPEPVQ